MNIRKTGFDSFPVFDAIEQAIFLHDEAFNIFFANNAYIKLVGKSQEEVLYKPYWESFPLKKFPLQSCLTASKTLRWESEEIKLDDGRILLNRACPIYHNGHFLYSVHTLEDITDRKHFLQTIQNENINFKVLFEDAIDAFFVYNSAGKFVKVNQAACDLLGYTHEELLNLHVFDIEVAVDKEVLLNIWREALYNKPNIIEGISRKKDGTEFPVEVNFNALKLDNESFYLAIVRDVTKRKKMENELIRYAETQKHSNQYLESIFIKTIMAFASTIEKRDPFTAGHQVRVATFASAIAKRMQLSYDQIQGIYLGALVHDIGKVHIPIEFLITPKRLTPEQSQVIQKHVEIGYDIVSQIPFKWPISDIILQHHERLDGSGYPNALNGDQISLAARIVSVADVVEAKTSNRPYRKSLSMDQVLLELKNDANKLYDKNVVDCCISLIRDEKFNFPPVNYDDVIPKF